MSVVSLCDQLSEPESEMKMRFQEKKIAPKSLQDVEQSLMEDYYRGELNIYKYMIYLFYAYIH